MLVLLDRMGHGDVTVHGFRSSFRGWSGEKTNYPREICELAERYPALVRRIAAEGFEVGSHTYSHVRLDTDDRAACIEDITRSKRTLEDVAGVPVVGFRSPTWKASLGDDWLWDQLIALGFRYDSSLFPFRTHMYGSNDNPVRRR